MEKNNVILIGMSGAGKSTLGVLLAKALGKDFTDTDILIQQKTGKLLQEIIDEQGAARFMEIEEEILSSLDVKNHVIATGDSAVYSSRGMKHLLESGRSVYLKVEYAELAKRLSNISTRGIVFREKGDLEAVWRERLPLYESYGEIHVDCTSKSVEESVLELVAALTAKKKLILASQSPRRREILSNLGVKFEVKVSDADESSDERDPKKLVEELSRRKAEAVRDAMLCEGKSVDECVILASDTVVSVDGEILGKPRDQEEAKRMLRMLSGRRHEVISGLALIGYGKCGTAHEVTEVEFDEMDEETIDFYVREAKPYDKAGAYAIQGLASAWIKGIHGCYFNVVGLPVHRLNCLYEQLFGEKFL